MLSIGNTLYVFGGCGAKGRMSDLYSYDIEERSWTKLPTCETRIPGRGGAGFVNSSDSKSIFIVGGFAGKEMNDVFRYDIETQKYYEVCSQDDTNINNKLRFSSISKVLPVSEVGMESILVFPQRPSVQLVLQWFPIRGKSGCRFY